MYSRVGGVVRLYTANSTTLPRAEIGYKASFPYGVTAFQRRNMGKRLLCNCPKTDCTRTADAKGMIHRDCVPNWKALTQAELDIKQNRPTTGSSSRAYLVLKLAKLNKVRKRKACDPDSGHIYREAERKRKAGGRSATMAALCTAVLLANPTLALCLMESEGKLTSGRLFHATPFNYDVHPHPTQAALRGIVNTGFIMPLDCHGTFLSIRAVWFATLMCWAISHTLAHHPDAVRASDYWITVYSLDCSANASPARKSLAAQFTRRFLVDMASGDAAWASLLKVDTTLLNRITIQVSEDAIEAAIKLHTPVVQKCSCDP